MAENESPSLPPPSRPAAPPIVRDQPAAGTESTFQQKRPAEFLVPRQPAILFLNSQGQRLQSEKPQPPASSLSTKLPPLNLKANNFAYEEPANDGYNWEMYLQKRVKSCPYPLTYYKCIHADCPALKRVERAQNGQITETVYKGHHSHPPPAKDPQHVSESEDLEEEGEAETWVVEPEFKKRRFNLDMHTSLSD